MKFFLLVLKLLLMSLCGCCWIVWVIICLENSILVISNLNKLADSQKFNFCCIPQIGSLASKKRTHIAFLIWKVSPPQLASQKTYLFYPACSLSRLKNMCFNTSPDVLNLFIKRRYSKKSEHFAFLNFFFFSMQSVVFSTILFPMCFSSFKKI